MRWLAITWLCSWPIASLGTAWAQQGPAAVGSIQPVPAMHAQAEPAAPTVVQAGELSADSELGGPAAATSAADLGSSPPPDTAENADAPEAVAASEPSGDAAGEQVSGEAGPSAPPAAEVAEEGGLGSADELAQAPPPWRVTVSLGGGLGTRRYRRPTPLGAEAMPTSTFPALDTALRIAHELSPHYALEVLVRYQTSLGMTVESSPPFALPVEHDARSQRAELSLAPVFRFGDDPGALALSPQLGMSLRGFAPDVRNQPAPAYYLVGPHARIELLVGVVRGLQLRLGPEVQWIVGINRSLTQDGVSDTGLAVGGEVTAVFELSDRFALEASYRQAHAAAGHRDGGVDFEDVERFATLRLAGRL